MINKKQIIISAYTVCPERGSESGLSWNWIIGISKYYYIHLITSTEYKNQLEKGISQNNLNNIKVYFNEIGKKATIMGKNQGDWRFYFYYNRWQKKTFKIAQNICKSNDIILAHQLNMIGFREPGYLWKLKLPTLWGPIGGLDIDPPKLDEISNFKHRLRYKLSKIQLKYFPNILNAFKKFNKILIAASDYNSIIKREISMGPFTVESDTGVLPKSNKKIKKDDKEIFQILWVGKDVYRKRLDLALRSISKLDKSLKIKLVIVGIEKKSSGYKKYEDIINMLNISDKITWKGMVTNSEVNNLMLESDLFLFTSISEAASTVVMEAINNQLPVLCFDLCGMKDIVIPDVGIKITPNETNQSIKDFSNSILHLYNDRDLLNKFSENCITYREQLTYPNKVIRMLKYYEEAINNFQKNKNV